MTKTVAYFVPSLLSFIPASWKSDGTYSENTWPEDATEVSNEDAEKYWRVTPPAGKILGAKNSKPVWVDIPTPTYDELLAAAERYRQHLLNQADATMLDWRTELMLGEISDANRAKLSAWLAYKNEVKEADVTIDPENVNWPVPPEV
ncbi:TPA: tail fiber assembly protein [Escherichia coli]|uniref:tail fiber assembly protein n=1 Tax=Citrobacter freundii TaxID=546 RepID=UPI000AB38216|nr:tail fiber assembly protein [Citrobacter freundii]EFS5601890.1 tail fiber assembly protein [Escherichia coli]MEC5780668.1 tail fiber assembly protein [Citrobacter freundii]MEC5782682.1 tail fiber assembly protein [Citrobacter freundii]QLU13141.1 tail fiber assembly protein [Citrobacter freundii]QLU14328.1 tail fiber assembly protein [Citrobacter freundii]